MPNVTVDGGIIHYETAGEGRPLVLLHGIGSNSRSWRRQLDGLSSHFKVIAWNAPGYGQSSGPVGRPSIRFYADRLRGLLDALGLKSIFLLGHSIGGVVAQEFYRTNPEYVRALILCDTRFLGSESTINQRLTSIRAMTPAQRAAERAPKVLSRNAPQELIREVQSIMSEVRSSTFEFAALALTQSDTRVVLRRLGVPTLLIWGSEDEITPLWEDVPPGAHLEIIPHAGHLCYIEQPERFNAIVQEFLSEDHSS